MRETLYLRLGASPEADCEYGVAGADLRSLRTQRGSLDQATGRSLVAGRRVIVFVPAADVRLASARVPARQPSKVLQAVPYVLEDQLADDVDTLHFAIGPRQPDGSHPVAVVSRAWLARQLAALRARGVQPDAVVPEVLALPVDASGASWSALLDRDQVCVRSGAWSGFTCAVDDLDSYLVLADPDGRQALRLQLAGDSGFDGTRLQRAVTLLPQPAALYALVNHYAPEHAINLLQAGFAPARDLDRLWKPWRLAAALLAGWITLSGAGHAIDVWRLGAELERQDAANIARFQQLFPDQTRIVDLSAQLDQQLRALASGGGAGPLVLFEPLADALRANPRLRLNGLQYRENALFLSMTAPDLQVLENLRNGFAQRADATLEVQSANAESGAVQIRARLTRT